MPVNVRLTGAAVSPLPPGLVEEQLTRVTTGVTTGITAAREEVVRAVRNDQFVLHQGLLALTVYGRYEEQGESFVPAYLDLLKAGGSRSPEELGQIVGVDLADPGFWDGGLAIVEAGARPAEQILDHR